MTNYLKNMELSREVPSVSQYTDDNLVNVKHEPEDENVFADVQSNCDIIANEEYTPTMMEVIEEKPVTSGIIENIEIKEENIEDSSCASGQEFVFVSCDDNGVLNELKLEEQNADLNDENMCYPSPEKTEKNDQVCPYCKEMYTRSVINAHKVTCESKFAYTCTICPAVLMTKSLIESHVLAHENQLNGSTVDEIVQNIIAKKIELKASNKVIYQSPPKRKPVTGFAYLCTLCPVVLTQENLLQKHLKTHGNSLNDQNIADIVEEIVKNKVALNANTPQERNKLVIEIMNKTAPIMNKKVLEKSHQSCPYCKKMFTSRYIKKHKTCCDSKYIYSCTLCPVVLMRDYLIGSHVLSHGNALNGKSTNEIIQEIIATKKEWTAHTPDKNSLLKNPVELCPYCKRLYSQKSIRRHMETCDKNFVYSCTLCPTVLLRRGLVKRHVNKHGNVLNGKSVKEIVEEIIEKKIEVNANTPEERRKLLTEIMNSNMRANMKNPVVNRSQFPLILPVSNITHQPPQSVMIVPTMTQKSKTPVLIKQKPNVSTTVKIQRSTTGNPAKKQKLDVQNDSQEFILPDNNLPITVNIQSQPAVTEKKPRAKITEIHCNECSYKTHEKSLLMTHITAMHGRKLNLIRFECINCENHFPDSYQLNVHKSNCKAKTFYSCLFCPKVSVSRVNILNHISKQHTKEVAGKEFNEIERLVDSKRKTVENVASVCSYKKRKLTTESTMLKSLLVSKTNPLVTDTQNQPVIAEGGRAVNRQSVLLPCNQCTYKSWDKSNLARHIRCCHTLKPQIDKCRKCKKVFQNLEELKAHEADCKIALYFSCPYCTKLLLAKGAMINHIEKNHLKEIEGKNAVDISLLIEANKKSVDTLVLNEQLAIQKRNDRIGKARLKRSKLECFSCDHCDYQSINKAWLVNHVLKTHSVELNLEVNPSTRKVRCTDCRQRVKENYLVPHSYSCREKFNYTCLFCPEVHLYMCKIKTHLLAKHSSEFFNKSIEDVTQEIFLKRTKFEGFKNNVDDAKKNVAKADGGKKVEKTTKVKVIKTCADATKTVKKKASKGNGDKEDVDINPDDIDASNLDYVICYCIKCKVVRAIRNIVKPSRSRCRDCRGRVIYLCSKCKEMHTVQLPRLNKHWKECNQNNGVSQTVLDNLVLYKCSECKFLSTHKHKYAMHIARSKHKPMQGFNDKNGEVGENKDDIDDMNIYDEEKFTIEPCVIDLMTMTHRYCPKCEKIVTEEMQDRKNVIKGKCKDCNTDFVPQCTKCNIRANSWLNMRYHLSAKCFSGLFECIKCKHRTRNWNLMQKHYINNHTKRRQAFLCEFCSFNSIHRTNFYTHLKKIHPKETEHIVLEKEHYFFRKKDDIDYKCEHCSFTSKHKNSVKVHLQLWHGKKKNKCKLCKFKTRYHASLARHIATRHKNYY